MTIKLDRRFKIGDAVLWRDHYGEFGKGGTVYMAQVIRHGRDATGIYTEIELDSESGDHVRVHRSQLQDPLDHGFKCGAAHE